jgi:hypothetical protein
MAKEEEKPSDKEAQQAAAQSLQDQIDAIIRGQAGPQAGGKPGNLRDFIQEKMAEDRRKQEASESPKTEIPSGEKKSKP